MKHSSLSHSLAVYHCLADGKHYALSHYTLLLKNIGPPEEILRTPIHVYEKAGMPAGFCNAMRAYQKGSPVVHAKVESDLAWQAIAGNRILVVDGEGYPPLLRAIHDPPPLLYLKGDASILCSPVLAMVGSRKPTPAGRRLARRFARELADCGVTVSSGLAYGIDSESHHGTLEAEGKTIAVLGGGLNCLYPRAHQPLAEDIIDSGGCLLSEFPLDFQPRAWCFPMRNRVVTGISRGVLVVEAALKSGSLVSARCALEQGREVYAIPGHIDSPQSRGCHHLIREGASLVESARDILADWDDLMPGAGVCGDESEEGSSTRSSSPGSPGAAAILKALGHGEQSVDALARLTGNDVSELSVLLGELEIRGLVSRQGSTYCRAGS